MTEKERFVHLALSGKFAISELCDQHGISRKTGHKYINRYKAQGRDGLVERSRRPKTYANASDAHIIRLILLEKRKHPNWGGKKIRQLLKTVYEGELMGSDVEFDSVEKLTLKYVFTTLGGVIGFPA